MSLSRALSARSTRASSKTPSAFLPRTNESPPTPSLLIHGSTSLACALALPPDGHARAVMAHAAGGQAGRQPLQYSATLALCAFLSSSLMKEASNELRASWTHSSGDRPHRHVCVAVRLGIKKDLCMHDAILGGPLEIIVHHVVEIRLLPHDAGALSVLDEERHE